MHPITSQMQAQLIGEDHLRAAAAARLAALAPRSERVHRVRTTSALRQRLRELAPTRSSRACEPAC